MMYRILIALMMIIATMSSLLSAQNTQNFVVKPTDQKVNLGETAVLKCSVSSRHGDVQWIHDGTALGYDRQVPGKPRYSVNYTDQNEDTEFHLQIVNVTLDDEGLFACQVAPIGDWDTKLEAKARLKVLIPPKHSPPSIMFNDESKNADDIVHYRSASQKSTKFSCMVRKARPAAVIKWYLNGSLVSSSVGKVSETKQSDGAFEDVISVLELNKQASSIGNNSILKCQAFHESYGLDVQLKNLSVALKVVVVYPPSPPTITGYDTQVGVVAGSELNLLCSSSHSHPPAMLSWYRDNKLVSRNYDTIESTRTSESYYRLAPVAPADNKAVLKCNAINQAMDEPYSTNITLNVLYGPEKLTMQGVFEVEVGKQISATCFSEPANPSPSLRFNLAGIDYEPSSLASTPTVAGSTAPAGSFVVNGTFVYTVKQDDNFKELKCYVENKAANVRQIVTKQIKVLYPPDYIEMRHNLENKVLNEGAKVRVVCLSRGGNPLPDIEWYLDGKKLSAHSSQSVVYTVESVLDLVVQREHHNKILECRSLNKVGSVKKELQLSVAYLPSNVAISMVEPTVGGASVKSGTRVVFSCRSANSNPQPFITWFKDGYPILLNSDEEQNLTSLFVSGKEYDTTSYMSFVATSSDHMKEIRCDVKVKDQPRTMHGSLILEVKFAPEIIKYPTSVVDVVENNAFNLNLTARSNPAPAYKCSSSNNKKYTVANATLSFTAARSDNGQFICSISNSESQTDVSFRLNVKYAPTARINSSLHVVSRGDRAQIFCLLDGNPLQASHVTWKLKSGKQTVKDDDYYQIKFVPPNLSVLTILNVRENDDGEVSCHVSNSIGASNSSSTELRVKRTPHIQTDLSELKAGEDSNIGRSAQFKCVARAYPDATFKWKKSTTSTDLLVNSTKYTITSSRNATDSQMFISTLVVHSVVSQDYGTYLCEAKNDIGSTLAKALLSGKHQPEQPSEFRVVNITKNTIGLAWKKNFDGGETQKFLIRYRKDTLDPSYKYVETTDDASGIVLDSLEPATRYVINIQSLNKFGTEGFLREPLIVQTDFGFSAGEVNQLPMFNNSEFPLTVILIICSSGTLFMLLNVAFIVYLVRRRKRKGEADSTTDTNETEANTVEMFSPPPPYPDELNYHFDFGGGFDDENKPFVTHINNMSSKYLAELGESGNCLDYAIEYATPIHQSSWPTSSATDPADMMDDEVYLTSLRQLDKNISSNIYQSKPVNLNNTNVVRSSFNPNTGNTNNRFNTNYHNHRPPGHFGSTTAAVNSSSSKHLNSSSFHQNLNGLLAANNSSFVDSKQTAPTHGHANSVYFQEARPFPYDRSSSRLNVTGSRPHLNNVPLIKSSQNNINLLSSQLRTNSTCKLYPDQEFTRSRGDLSKQQHQHQQHQGTSNFKGHLV